MPFGVKVRLGSLWHKVTKPVAPFDNKLVVGPRFAYAQSPRIRRVLCDEVVNCAPALRAVNVERTSAAVVIVG